jgi:ribosome assembly protein YihI (activator of Der GTPase)
MTTFGAVKQLIRIVERQNKRIKKLEEQLGLLNDETDDDDTDEPYVKECCDECDIDTLTPEPDEPVGV